MRQLGRFGVIAVVGLIGCSPSPGLVIDTWTLEVDGESTEVRLPAQPEIPDADLSFRLRADVDVPEALRRRPLEVSVPVLGGRAALLVDGLPAPLIEGREHTYRSRGPLRWHVPPEALVDGRLSLELEVQHRWRGSGRLDVAPRLLPANGFDVPTAGARVFHLYLAIAALIALAQVGLTCVVIFLVDRRRKSYLWFGIQALFALYYPLYVSGLSAWLGPLDLLFLPITLIGATHVAVLFTHAHFELPAPSRLWWVSGIGVPIASVLVWVMTDPFTIVDIIGPPLVVAIGVAIAYQLATCFRLYRVGENPASVALLAACWGAVGLTAWVDFLAWLGAGEVLGGVHPASLGLTLFAFFLALLLGRGHIRSLNRSDELNAELLLQVDVLETRGGEISRLNTELTRQLEERSAQILAALTLGGSLETKRAELHEGDVVQGRYRVIRTLGSGGMGAVYEVCRETDGVHLALKVAQETRGLALARLAREAQIACRVSHPHVVRVHDVDVASHGFVYIVMELVDGETLSAFDKRGRSVDGSLELLAQIAEGLGALHDAGIVHRDLKPANILVTAVDGAPFVKLVDFGISRVLDFAAEADEQTLPEIPHMRRDSTPGDTEATAVQGPPQRRGRDSVTPARPSSSPPPPTLTKPGHLPGTPSYLAPELVQAGARLTAAADLFSFGVLGFQLLTGVRPFAEPAASALLAGREVSPPPLIADVCPGVSPTVAALMQRCVGLEPEGRPSTAELVIALREARSAAE